MPRTRSVRAVVAEVVMYVGMFAIVGHMSQNLYERFMMHSELNGMKADLNSLEVIVNTIGMAYDTLRDEMQELLLTSKDPCKSVYADLRPSVIRPTYNSYVLHKPKHSSVQCPPALVDVMTGYEKNTKDFMQNFKKSTKNFLQECNVPVKNETTFTERLVRCMSAGCDREKVNNETNEFCKCIVKCISLQDGNYKVVNQQNVKFPSVILEGRESITNETSKCSCSQTFRTL